MPLGPATAEDLFCSEDGCEDPALARGLCRRHYQRRWNSGQLPKRTEKVPTVAMTVRIPARMHSALMKLRRVSGRTLTSLIEEGFAEYLTKFKQWPPK